MLAMLKALKKLTNLVSHHVTSWKIQEILASDIVTSQKIQKTSERQKENVGPICVI